MLYTRKEKKVLVSVIVPIYNREAEIEKCILSIIHQTYKDMEIILVDDGSTDGSLGICKQYADIDDRIHIIHKENGGLISARKAGLQKASGEYVAHIDGDDWIEENYIETLVKATDYGTVDVVVAGFVNEYIGIREDNEKVLNALPCGLYTKKEIEDLIYPVMLNSNMDGYNEIYPCQWAKLFKRELAVKKQMLVDDRYSCDEDTLCVYPILLCAGSIRIIDACQYHYVRRMDSLSTYGTDAVIYFDTVKYMYKYLKNEIEQYEKKESLMLQLEKLVSARITAGMKKYYSLLINQYIFPYGLIVQGSRVALYGAGAVGRCFYRQLMKDKYCKIELWVDKNYKTVDISYAEVKEPKLLLQEQCDYIIVCLQNELAAQSIISDLKSMGIEENKIVWRADYKADMDIRFHG